MRAVIFANGRLTRPIILQPDDLIIAADGGSHHCLGLGIRPQVVIGDLDSVRDDELEALSALGTEIITYPARKDFTDLELALQHARDHGAEEVIVLGALGGRWDQTLANVLLPVSQEFKSLPIRLMDGAQEILLIHPGRKTILHGRPGDTLSLIPLMGDTQHITTEGLEYPLSNEKLLFGSTRGVSNRLLGEKATISFESGMLLCVVIHENGVDQAS